MIGSTNVSVFEWGPSASIIVSTSESTLIGTTCLLKLNNVTVKSAVFDSIGVATFTRITEADTYTVEATNGTDTATEEVVVSASDISEEVIKNVTVSFSAPLPIANIGDVIQIGGYNCMCIGTNRYIFMTNLGNRDWNSAVTTTQNWSAPSAITDLYNVFDTALMTKAEAEGLTHGQRTSLNTAIGQFLLLGTVSDPGSHAVYAIVDGNVYDGLDQYSSSPTAPAFTISRK